MSTAVTPIQSTNFNQTINDPMTNTITFVPTVAGISSAKTAGKLADALAKAQATFKTVLKDKTAKGEKFSYKYADLSSVLEMVVPALAAQGIAFTQPLRREGDKTYVVTRIQLGDEFLEDAGLPIPSQVRPQELGTYLSYYRRYGVSTFLGIAADEDTDAVETRPDFKPSTSGQDPRALMAAHEKDVEAASGKNETLKRGRPAVAKTVAPVVPTAPATPPIATDSDIPANIGNKPTTEERKEFLDRLKKHIEVTGKEPMKAFLGGSTDLSKREWIEILEKLDEAVSKGTLKELVKV